jgi:YegS/Rv2252/BmrU family lipid kinase
MENLLAYQRALVIINPVSGQQDEGQHRQMIEDRLNAAQVSYEVRETQGKNDAFRWAEQAASERFELVIVAGGDGTVMEAMSGLLKSGASLPLAQIPSGTANLLARALLIPTDPQEALELVFSGKQERLDVGYLPDEQRYFSLMAGAGYDARLIKDANRELKNSLGFAAYLLTGLKNLFRLPPARIDLEVDGQHHRFRAHTVMVMNVGQIGSNLISLGPDIYPHDGKLNLAVFSSLSLWGAIRILFLILTRQFVGHSDLSYFRASQIRVSAYPPLPTEIDGESLGNTPLRIKIIPNGISLIVPQDYQAAKEGSRSQG